MNKDNQIKSTDWLATRYSEEENAKMKAEAIKEAEAELREKQIEERLELSGIIGCAVNEWEDICEECHKEGYAPTDTMEECIADYVLAAGYRKQSQPISCGHEKGGEWIAHRDPFDICATDFVCSACRESFCSSELTDDEFFEMMKYCPNCGVKMGGGDNDA